ncbi:MAG: hypothetical protein HC903_19280 [Methylacidiphilales bacterium]|nr:hypothetical protein [Candidatus Methylacidiphilales bacterium]
MLNEAQGTVLKLGFQVAGTIPAAGIIVTLGGEFNDTFDELRFQGLVASPGVTFVRFNPANNGFEFRLTQASATVDIPILDDVIQESDRTFKYEILPGTGYTVSPTANSANITLTDGVPGGAGPTVSMTVDKSDLKEGDRFTIKFNVTGEIPPEGVTVYVDGDKSGGLGEFDVAAIDLTKDITGTDGRLPRPDGNAGGFLITLTQPEASLSLKILDDGPNEGAETLNFKLRDGEKYNISPTANAIALNINDGGTGMGDTLPTVGISLTALTVDQQDNLLAPYLVQSATYKDATGTERNGSSLVNLSLNLDGNLPSEGLVVNVTADKDLARIFTGLSRPVFSPGAQILGPLFNAAGETIGFQVKLLTPNPIITLRVNNNTLLTNELTRLNFAVQPGEGYAVSTKALQPPPELSTTSLQYPLLLLLPKLASQVSTQH